MSVLRELYGATATHSNLRTTLGILGKSCSALGNSDMAVSFLRQALENHYEVCKKKGEETDAERNVEVALLNALGNVYKAQEAVLEALQCYQKCLEIQSAIVDDRNIVLTLANIGNTYCLMGIPSKGVKYLEMAYNGVKTILEESEPQTVINASVLSKLTCSLWSALSSMMNVRHDKIKEITDESERLVTLLPKTSPLHT